MICPGCGWNMPDNTQFCTNCGKQMPTQSAPTSLTTEEKAKRPKMVFNIIFAAWMMFSYASGAYGAMGIFTAESLAEVLAYLFSIAISAIVVVTGISLINRKKFGFIAQYIINSLGILINAFLFFGSLFLIFLFDGSASEYDQVFNVLWDFIFWLVVIFSLPGLGMHLAGIIYYSKNKKKYFATGEEKTVNGEVVCK